MRFARIVFTIAGVWGIIVLIPLCFMFDAIGRESPPPITHPEFFYGFAGVALAWQIAFLLIAREPVRLRPIMVPAVVEKFGFVAAVCVLYAQRRLPVGQIMVGAGADLILGVLFVAAFPQNAVEMTG